MEKIRIILADDHQLFRNGLKMLLENQPEFEIAGEASNGIEFLDVLKNCHADIALMDINMAEMDGVDATRRGIRLCPSLSVIALSMYGEEEWIPSTRDIRSGQADRWPTRRAGARRSARARVFVRGRGLNA